MVNLDPHQSLPIISFDSFEPIELGIILPTSFTVSSRYPQVKLHV